MKAIYIASQNEHKIREIESVLAGIYIVKTVSSLGQKEELPETGSTLIENALQKARFVYDKFNVNCFADDSGLEVAALNNEPGVYSARYAGEQKNANDNIQLLLKNLGENTDRKACFKTVIALVLDGKEYLFEGVVKGEITRELRGSNGFGYDPVFIPDGYAQTFAEMDSAQKNSISHRAIAVKKLAEFLTSLG